MQGSPDVLSASLVEKVRFYIARRGRTSSNRKWKGYEVDLELGLPKSEDYDRGMDGGASAVTFVAAGLQVAKTAKGLCEDYRDAPKQVSHAQHLTQQVRLNLEQINQLSSSKKARIAPASASLNDVQAALPIDLHVTRKRDRLKWITGPKAKFDKEISQNNRTESSATFNLLLSLAEDIERIRLDSANRHEEKKERPIYPAVVYAHRLVCSSYIREQRAAQVRRWTWLAEYLGIKSGVVISNAKDRSLSTVFARWPLALPFRLSQVITVQMIIQNGVPSLPKLGLRPQNIIPRDSEIIGACQAGNLPRIQELLLSRRAHPNDRTPDDLTVFRYAVRGGNSSVVQLLLDHGADPNLPYGIYETSPLDNAFRIGNADSIRRLLLAGADLDYRNSRAWTALSYLWDPELDRKERTRIGEILEICMSQGFSAWNDTDPSGWTPCHRAGAYGSGEDMHNLHYKGGNMRSNTTDLLWGPINCAVWNSNEATFDALMNILDPREVLNVVDSRGWTLLHLAAQNGSRHIMKRLLDIGAKPGDLTMGTEHVLRENLKWQRLTAETIAREYGHGELWESVIQSVHKQ